LKGPSIQSFNLFFSFLFLLFLSGGLAAAQEGKQDKPEETFEQKFIRNNIEVTEWFNGTAEGLDLFLTGRDVSKVKNNSHVRLTNTSYSVEGSNLNNQMSLGVELRLPNLEELWKLQLSSFNEAEERRTTQKGHLDRTQKTTNYGATLGVFRRFGNVRTSFQPRVDFTDPLRVSHSAVFESIATFDSFAYNPKLEFFATPDKGTGIDTAHNLNFILNPKWSFTIINNWEYEEKLHKLSAGNGFSFNQIVNPVSSLSYTWMSFSDNRDNYHLVGYTFSATLSHLIYKRVLDFQLTPHLDFMADHMFIGNAGLIFALNVTF
jgi:hypothetical protein